MGISDLPGALKNSKLGLNFSIFVFHHNFLHPKSGGFQDLFRRANRKAIRFARNRFIGKYCIAIDPLADEQMCAF